MWNFQFAERNGCWTAIDFAELLSIRRFMAKLLDNVHYSVLHNEHRYADCAVLAFVHCLNHGLCHNKFENSQPWAVQYARGFCRKILQCSAREVCQRSGEIISFCSRALVADKLLIVSGLYHILALAVHASVSSFSGIHASHTMTTFALINNSIHDYCFLFSFSILPSSYVIWCMALGWR